MNDAILGVAPLPHRVANDVIMALELAGCDVGAMCFTTSTGARIYGVCGGRVAIVWVGAKGSVNASVYRFSDEEVRPDYGPRHTGSCVASDAVPLESYTRRWLAPFIDAVQKVGEFA